MLTDLIEKYRVNKAIRKNKLEKKIEQACCPHKIVSIGEYSEMYYTGYDADFRTCYQAYCPICDKTFRYSDKESLQIALAKQKAKDEYILFPDN